MTAIVTALLGMAKEIELRSHRRHRFMSNSNASSWLRRHSPGKLDQFVKAAQVSWPLSWGRRAHFIGGAAKGARARVSKRSGWKYRPGSALVDLGDLPPESTGISPLRSRNRTTSGKRSRKAPSTTRLFNVRAEQPKTHTVFLRIRSMFKQIFRWLRNRMAGESHDIFPLPPLLAGHGNRKQLCGETLRFLP
jgi:hypothetical protein